MDYDGEFPELKGLKLLKSLLNIAFIILHSGVVQRPLIYNMNMYIIRLLYELLPSILSDPPHLPPLALYPPAFLALWPPNIYPQLPSPLITQHGPSLS